jgi:hypothetical protein
MTYNRTNGWVKRYGKIDGRMNEWIDGWVYGSMDILAYGWMAGWMSCLWSQCFSSVATQESSK